MVGRTESLPSQEINARVEPDQTKPLSRIYLTMSLAAGPSTCSRSCHIMLPQPHGNCDRKHTVEPTKPHLSNRLVPLPSLLIVRDPTHVFSSKPRLQCDLNRACDSDNSTGSLHLRISPNTTFSMGDTAKSSSPPAKSPTNPASSPIHGTVPLIADEVITREPSPPSEGMFPRTQE